MIHELDGFSGKGLKILIVDSGVSYHKDFDKTITGFSFVRKENQEIVRLDDFTDFIGHGTAIYGIISKKLPDAEIINVRFIENEATSFDEEVLFNVFSEIATIKDVNILNLSLGMIRSDKEFVLKELINQITSNGTIVISAFHYLNTLSLPAYFPNVIGVDSNNSLYNDSEFIYSNSIYTNIEGMGRQQRVHWLENKYIEDNGSSFAAAHITGIVGQILEMYPKSTFEDVLVKLKLYSKNKKEIINSRRLKERNFDIGRSMLFPVFEKQNSILQHNSLIGINIVAVSNTIRSRQVKKNVQFDNNKYEIKDVFQLDFETFDTIILIKQDLGTNNVYETRISEVLDKCILKNKKIVSFDNSIKNYFLSSGGNRENFYAPEINQENFPAEMSDKLFISNTPVLGFFTTGKNYIQNLIMIKMIKKLEELEYKVGSLTTDTELQFSDLDYVLPLNNTSSYEFYNKGFISLTNKLIHDIEEKNRDIIFVSNNEGLVAKKIYNIGDSKSTSYDFIQGTQPDIAILIADENDEYEFVIRNINCLRVISNTPVIAIVMEKKNDGNNNEIEGIPIFEYSENLADKLVEMILEWYSV